MASQCKVCLIEAAIIVDGRVTNKELTHDHAAKELGVSLPEYISHYELHVRGKLVNALSMDIEPIKDGLISKIQAAHKSLDRLLNVTQMIYDKLSNDENIDNVKLITAYASLEKNVMTGLKDCATLEGDINTATQINIQHNEIKVDTLMSIIMEDAPPELQSKILKKISAIKKPELYVEN